MGTYAIELAKVSRNVIAFEPVRLAHQILTQVVPSNVGCFEFALGETNETGTILIPVHEGRPVTTRATLALNRQVEGTRQITEIRNFDEGWPQFRPRADAYVDFIKIDVEGYELHSLKGMIRTIQQFLPSLLIEIELRHNPSFSEVFALLESLSYRSFYSPDGVELVGCSAQDLPGLQTKERLDLNRRQRLKRYSRGNVRHYINNFWFLHSRSRAASRLKNYP